MWSVDKLSTGAFKVSSAGYFFKIVATDNPEVVADSPPQEVTVNIAII